MAQALRFTPYLFGLAAETTCPECRGCGRYAPALSEPSGSDCEACGGSEWVEALCVYCDRQGVAVVDGEICCREHAAEGKAA